MELNYFVNNMKRFSISLFLYLIFAIQVFAQSQETISVLINEKSIQNQFDEILLDSVISKLNNSIRYDFQIFYFNEENQKLDWTGDEEVKFSNKILFINPTSRTKEVVEFHYTEKGNIESANLYPGLIVSYQYKLMDIGTSELIEVDNITFEDWKKDNSSFNTPIKINTNKYLKANKKLTEKALRPRIIADQKAKLQETYLEMIKSKIRVHYDLSNRLKSLKDTRLFNITIPDEKGYKRSFKIDAGKDEELSWLSDLRIVKKVKIAGTDQVEYLGTAIVKKTFETEAKAGFVLTGFQKLKNALEEGAEVYAVRNRKLLNELDSNEPKLVRVGIKKSKLFSNIKAQSLLSNIENIILVERGHDFILDYFKNLYKTEKYIDYDIESVLGDQQGIDYFFEFSTTNEVFATDVKTGKTKKVDNASEININDYRQFFLDLFGEEIKMLEVSKIKKDKVQNIILYSPYAFDSRSTYIDIFQLIEENVGGKSIARKNKIGSAWVTKKYSDYVAEISLISGKKDVGKALKNNTKLVFDYYITKN